MEIRDVDIMAIKPYERNAKQHPAEQVKQIAKSIEKFGWAQPLAIDGDGEVVIGHGRLLAAKKLGLKTVPCVEIDGLTDEEIRMLRLADNKLNESPWDFDLLAEELEGLDFGNLDLDFFGIEESYLDDIENEIYSTYGINENDEFAVTFHFPKTREPEIKDFINSHGNGYVVDMIMREVEKDA